MKRNGQAQANQMVFAPQAKLALKAKAM